jgi:hypothetical protein
LELNRIVEDGLDRCRQDDGREKPLREVLLYDDKNPVVALDIRLRHRKLLGAGKNSPTAIVADCLSRQEHGAAATSQVQHPG